MAILILPTQIPRVWDSIKYAVSKVESLPNNELAAYFNRLLQSLLDGKAQCFVRLDDERQLLAIAITRITQDEITGDKALAVNCLYSFKSVDGSQWQNDIDIIKKFAKQSGCKKVLAYSTNPRVFEIVTSIGFKEKFRSFSIDLEEI